jgi:hypothetical protein
MQSPRGANEEARCNAASGGHDVQVSVRIGEPARHDACLSLEGVRQWRARLCIEWRCLARW